MRGAADALQQQFGPAAVELLNEALDDAAREIDQLPESDADVTDVRAAECRSRVETTAGKESG